MHDFHAHELGNRINSPFLLNEHGDSRFSCQVFAKNSPIKNIFEDEKSLIVEQVLF